MLGSPCPSTSATHGTERPPSRAALGLGLGLRRAEICALDLADIDLETGEVRVQRGKGRKARRVYAGNGALAALADWTTARGARPGPFITPINKGGRISIRAVSAHAVYLACQKRAAEAGVAPFTPHDLRRSYVGDLLDAGADISVAATEAPPVGVRGQSICRQYPPLIRFERCSRRMYSISCTAGAASQIS